jgi:hypothetical protein
MTDAEDDKAYEVGYRRPPKHSQFKKGQSGNPAGRPKGSRQLDPARILTKVVTERMLIREGGVERRVTRLEVALIQLANKAASGDLKALTTLLKTATALGLITADAGLVAGRDYGVLVVPQPLSPEEWDRVYGPTMIAGDSTKE